MKSTRSWLLSLFILILVACNSEDELHENQPCIDHFLEQFELRPYNGGEVPCGKDYLVLFENESTSFALLHNDCADLLPQLLIDCNGRELCTYVTEAGCFEMVMESENLGIIGIE